MTRAPEKGTGVGRLDTDSRLFRAATSNANTVPARAAMAPGQKNYAWDMIKQSPLESADRQMRELVMTLTGTIVVGKRPSDNDPLPIIYRGEGDPAILD